MGQNTTVRNFLFYIIKRESQSFFHSEIGEFQPIDATTNPSLVYAAVSKAEYSHLVNEAVRYAQDQLASASIDEKVAFALDHLVSTPPGKNLRHLCSAPSSFPTITGALDP